ncbi:MAG: H-NS family nucleoid-associated regulatory protein [Pseudomonadales bacterium]|uniref:H-NS family nucleoid-associated regulatory protein n=1 Tax=Cupriavidus basilensis TaxID=68895 RepID=UPI003D357ABF
MREPFSFGARAQTVLGSCFASTTPTPCLQKVHPIRFRVAEGHTWNGHGDLPEWIQRAVNAGQSPDHFSVS